MEGFEGKSGNGRGEAELEKGVFVQIGLEAKEVVSKTNSKS